jgi:hypothetical protein
MAGGKYQRSGPERVFVSPESATGLRNIVDPSSTIQIDANHSDMVKFSYGNMLIDRIASKLQDVLNINVSDMTKAHEGSNNTDVDATPVFQTHSQATEKAITPVDNSFDQEFWDIYGK